jgi:hypothetical protein
MLRVQQLTGAAVLQVQRRQPAAVLQHTWEAALCAGLRPQLNLEGLQEQLAQLRR